MKLTETKVITETDADLDDEVLEVICERIENALADLENEIKEGIWLKLGDRADIVRITTINYSRR